MIQRQEEQPTTWRDNWFIVNWLMAILIVRSVFKPSVAEGVDTFLGDASMLTVGTLFMVMNVFGQQMDDEPMIKAGKGMATMVTGMATGMAGYNTAKGLLKGGIGFFSEDTEAHTTGETETLLPTSHSSHTIN